MLPVLKRKEMSLHRIEIAKNREIFAWAKSPAISYPKVKPVTPVTLVTENDLWKADGNG